LTGPRDFRDFLKDIVEACHAILRFVDGMSLDVYLADEKTRMLLCEPLKLWVRRSEIYPLM